MDALPISPKGPNPLNAESPKIAHMGQGIELKADAAPALALESHSSDESIDDQQELPKAASISPKGPNNGSQGSLSSLDFEALQMEVDAEFDQDIPNRERVDALWAKNDDLPPALTDSLKDTQGTVLGMQVGYLGNIDAADGGLIGTNGAKTCIIVVLQNADSVMIAHIDPGASQGEIDGLFDNFSDENKPTISLFGGLQENNSSEELLSRIIGSADERELELGTVKLDAGDEHGAQIFVDYKTGDIYSSTPTEFSMVNIFDEQFGDDVPLDAIRLATI